MVKYIQYLWEKEIIPTLETPEGENLNEYCNHLLKRYENSAIEHRTWQIAMDGSQKLPQRILETVTYLLKNEKSFTGMSLAVAAWMQFVSGIDLNGKTIDVRDPMADDFAAIFKKSKTSEKYVEALLNIKEVFPVQLRESSVFKKEIQTAYNLLSQFGSTGAIQKVVNVAEN
jgi:fructuronate reductase